MLLSFALHSSRNRRTIVKHCWVYLLNTARPKADCRTNTFEQKQYLSVFNNDANNNNNNNDNNNNNNNNNHHHYHHNNHNNNNNNNNNNSKNKNKNKIIIIIYIFYCIL